MLPDYSIKFFFKLFFVALSYSSLCAETAGCLHGSSANGGGNSQSTSGAGQSSSSGHWGGSYLGSR